MNTTSIMRVSVPARSTRSRILIGLVTATCLLAFIPSVVAKPMLLHVWIMLFLAIAQSEAWNVLGGYAGQHSIGHSAYFGIGAYMTMLTVESWQRSPLVGLCLATFAAVLLAGLIGSITFRLRGPYFVLASISVAEIIRLVAIECKTLTRGAEGILLTQIPKLHFGGVSVAFATKVPYFYASLGLASLAVATTWLVHNSKLGYYFQAIREDQDAAHSLGINPTLYKNLALAISAILTAWSGSLWALYVKFLDPNLAFGLDVSVQMLLGPIIGGIGTILGPVLGAFLLVLLSETLRNPKWLVSLDIVSDDSAFVAFVQQHLATSHVLFYGLLVVAVILFAPRGLLGLIDRPRLRAAPQTMPSAEVTQP
jgi:branched-chain amino acid transport system permease protein